MNALATAPAKPSSLLGCAWYPCAARSTSASPYACSRVSAGSANIGTINQTHRRESVKPDQ